MPLPQKSPSQTPKEFMDSCMANPTMNKEWKDNSQRYAICQGLLKKSKKTSKASTNEENIEFDWEEFNKNPENVLKTLNNKEINTLEIDLSEEITAAQKKFGGVKRSDLKSSDFLFPETKSYPLKTPADVPDILSNFGRGNHGLSYEAFVKKLYNKCKSKGPEFVAAIPESTLKKAGITK